MLFLHSNRAKHNEIYLYKGKGPILIGNGSMALFRNSVHNILSSECVLNPGRTLDMTNPCPPTNINQRKTNLIARHRPMYEIIQEVLRKKIVHLTGN